MKRNHWNEFTHELYENNVRARTGIDGLLNLFFLNVKNNNIYISCMATLQEKRKEKKRIEQLLYMNRKNK
jgi:hypothetical protein